MDHSAHSGASLLAGDHSGHGGHGGHGGDMGPMCNMNMIFTWDTTDLCIVFKWWHIRSNIGLVLALLSIIGLSAGYEWIRYRIRLLDNEVAASASLTTAQGVNTPTRLKQSIGYAIQVGYSYLLMLVFMTFNGWAMLSVAIGAGLGFWFWGDKAQRSLSCH